MYGGSAVFAGVTAGVTELETHQVWGQIAAFAYGLGALLALLPAGRRRRGVVAGSVFAGAVLLPLVFLIGTGQAQPEVVVVERSGQHLLEHGTPYLGPAELVGSLDYTAYNPYLPGMALFGTLGVDPRVVFGMVFLAAMAAAGLILRGQAVLRPLLFLAASPLVALPLAVGGDDLPVIGLACLGLALTVRWPGAAGLVLGVAATMKATAWPALAVCLALVAVRKRADLPVFAGAAAGAVTLGVLLPALVDPAGIWANAVEFPLGLADVASPAGSPLPGHLIAGLGPYGHAIAVAALAGAAVAMGVWLVVRPPRSVGDTVLRLALGLLLAALLMPATRWGYLIYPALLALWGWTATCRTEDEPCPAV
ncbi:glycosyltransferase 87 family protein [Actinocorallia populi]|uniref:glycosyltransferase 87 family protein n=1 Tax=Actinocorallia populi TaxID=2079200 RepID=UPI0013008508|nr:glycosyltransferase 87 family protein [Actinocorallia populi]